MNESRRTGSPTSENANPAYWFPIVVLGTRAQLIKMAPVLRELEARRIPFRLIFTGQHLVTMQDLLDDFGVESQPVWLGKPTEVDSMSKMLAWFLRSICRLAIMRRRLLKGPGNKDSIVIVHGDTMSTLVGALAARLNRCRVAHVESGLRSFNVRDPFPEELTRVLVFRLSNFAFCPGPWAANNMAGYRAEVLDTESNTLLDALRFAMENDDEPGNPEGRRYAVVSIHRHENLSSPERLDWILETVRDMSREYDIEFVLHPATQSRLERSGRARTLRGIDRISLRGRMGYLEFVRLLSGAEFVLTDGGSNQEELSYLGIPTLIARERTERKEGLGQNAELISPHKGPGWQDALIKVRSRLAGHDARLSSHSPSRRIVDWLEYGQ